MTIREMLVPVRGDGKGEDVLNHAVALATRFGAHIDTVHCRPRPEDMLSFDIRIPRGLRDQITASASSAADSDEAALRALFDRYCVAHDLLVCEQRPWPRDRASARWRDEIGAMPDVVGRLGRVYDLVVLARPDAKQKLGYRTLKSALLHSGRPAFLCPPEAGSVSALERPTIAWNGSTETARTVDAALPLLRSIGRVGVVSIDTGGQSAGPDAHALADHLREHEIEVDVQIVRADSRHVPARILDTAREAGADCLITGAFGHSRRLEFIMGSVTQHLIEQSPLPLFMMH